MVIIEEGRERTVLLWRGADVRVPPQRTRGCGPRCALEVSRVVINPKRWERANWLVQVLFAGGGAGGEERLCFFLVKMASLRRWHAVGRSLLLCSTDTQLPAWLWDMWVLLYRGSSWSSSGGFGPATTVHTVGEGERGGGTWYPAGSCFLLIQWNYFSELNLKTCTTELWVEIFLLRLFLPEFKLPFGNFLSFEMSTFANFWISFWLHQRKRYGYFSLNCLQYHVLI